MKNKKKEQPKASKNTDWILATGMAYVLGFSFKVSSIGWLKSIGMVLIIAGFLSSLLFALMLYYKNKDKISRLRKTLKKGQPEDHPKSPYSKWKEGVKKGV